MGEMIAVNLITGFLGVGKTTLIRHLLKQHPADQRWAVLVNEFGEIGVDGSLLDDEGVAIEEVAGGCLCCVAAPAFSVGLNRLIREQRPDRILIEPSGLGHPAQVLDTLRSPLYQNVLDVQATLCVMDARHLGSPRHREHPNFIDQIHLADVLIANKADNYSTRDEQGFMDFAASLRPPKSRLLITEQGRIEPQILDLHTGQRQAVFPEAHAFLLAHDESHQHPPESDWICVDGQGDGYHRLGWRMDSSHVFQHRKLIAWLDGLQVERIKGVVRCEDGWLSYNRSSDDARTGTVSAADASRLQLIDSKPLNLQQLDRLLHDQLLTQAV